MGSVRENLRRVREGIAEAALRSGRRPEEVKLIGATKGVPPERILEAVEAGLDTIGENYVQEAQRKYEVIGDRVKWHMIGRLQSNKAKHAVRLFEVIHSLSSLKLAQELQKRAQKEGRRIRVLVQVNLSGEETKAGVSPEGLPELIRAAVGMPNLEVLGLMTMPPYSEDPEDSRPFFRRLRELRDRLAEGGIILRELSMGMSNDYKVAVEEGATMVRIGTAIFGPRGR
ncbi:MAG: YggS family pyridoxal phosphate-dependent enzyme [Deltaproteobacteria bacterium]|nr:MAG: YggS family pyridoxal phosphate-dependent enzyme [Deltaproteobacteria bacterium]